MTEMAIKKPGAVANFPVTAKVKSALDLWLSGFSSENTWRAYAREIAAFAAFAGRKDVAEAVAHFLTLECEVLRF